jgi:hypothetical protein
MTKTPVFEAIETVVLEAMRDKTSKAGYAKTAKALLSLSLTDEERGKILYYMGYADSNGKPYQWIFERKKR